MISLVKLVKPLATPYIFAPFSPPPPAVYNGPFEVVAGQVYVAGAAAGTIYVPGSQAGQVN